MNTSDLQNIKQRYNVVGNSDGLNRALDVALQVASTDLSVLIIGESGVGKEIIPLIKVLGRVASSHAFPEFSAILCSIILQK